MATTALTEALLRDTFDRMAARYPAWPRSFDEVMADPARSRLVRITATRRVAAARRPVAPACTASPRRAAAPVPPASALISMHPPVFDRKRAAAGEREDD